MNELTEGIDALAEKSPIEEQYITIATPSAASIKYADYILNHYSKDSMMDKICLARDLEKHGFKKSYK